MKIALFSTPFYFLRHGETELNARRLIAGSLETDLTDLGRTQAQEAAAALAAEPITAIYSSPMRRARDTAVPIAERLKLPVTVIPELAERNWGAAEGQPRGSRLTGATPEGAEPWPDFTQRVLAGFAQIDSTAPLIVGHSGVYRVLCRALKVVEPERAVGNCLPLRIVPLPEGGWKLASLEPE